MLAFDGAAASRDGTAREALDAKQIESNRRSSDVGDTVERADFMKMNLGDGDAMDGRFGVGQPAKDRQGEVALPVGQLAGLKDRFHMMQVAMLVLVRRFDAYIGRGKTAFADFVDFQFDRQPQRSDASANRLRIDAGVDQRGQGHVAADAAEAVEVCCFHGWIVLRIEQEETEKTETAKRGELLFSVSSVCFCFSSFFIYFHVGLTP